MRKEQAPSQVCTQGAAAGVGMRADSQYTTWEDRCCRHSHTDTRCTSPGRMPGLGGTNWSQKLEHSTLSNFHGLA
ncbi:hypothetical protein BsWGS_27317 [Bradybaena similaris]